MKNRNLEKHGIGFLDSIDCNEIITRKPISHSDNETSDVEYEEIITRNTESIQEIDSSVSCISSECNEFCYCDYYDFNIIQPCPQKFHGYRKLTLGLYSETSKNFYTELSIQLFAATKCSITCTEKKGNFSEFLHGPVYYKYKKSVKEDGYLLYTDKLFFKY
jgi:hypothetical protein